MPRAWSRRARSASRVALAAAAAACRAWALAPPPIATERSAIFRGTGRPERLAISRRTDEARSREIAVPVGETIELNIPAVCLNYGWPTPTAEISSP